MEQNFIPFFILLIVVLFASGCTNLAKNEINECNESSREMVCKKPYILVGTSCCLDQNDNSICDTDETPKCTSSWQCSNWSNCSSAGSRTRTCMDHNGCPVKTNIPMESESCTPQIEVWHENEIFSGTSSKKTDTFTTIGKKWRFTWSCEKNSANQMEGYIWITVYKIGVNGYLESLMMQSCPETEETTFVYSGKGEYYFDTSIVNVEKWKIKVEDWY